MLTINDSYSDRWVGKGTASTILWYVKLSYWCRAPTKNLFAAII
ncbi:hypothetical protein FDUTEX481_08141 [Tolypothrix sp. PCC 7601]|nr:hypothetical protein FDUTEX481_08141 [Tolypothrix sp. PCC 7601]